MRGCLPGSLQVRACPRAACVMPAPAFPETSAVHRGRPGCVQGAERQVRVPGELSRFAELPMKVEYCSEGDADKVRLRWCITQGWVHSSRMI